MADTTTPSNVPGNVVDTESAQKQTATALVYRKPYLSNYHFLKVLEDSDFCFSDAGIEKQLEKTGKNRPVLEGF